MDRMDRMDRTRIANGYGVYTRDDHKVGSVENVAPDYFEVSTGFLGLGHPLFIPFEAVARVDDADQRVDLNVAKDALPADRWRDPPAPETRTPAGTMAGTMPAATAEAPAKGWIEPDELRGKALYTWDGHKLGDISGVGPDYVDVPTGVVGLGPRLYVPYNAISYCTQQGCYVNASLDQIKDNNWTVEPTATARPTGGMAAANVRPAADVPPARDVAANVPPATAATGQPMVRPVRVPLYEEELEVRRHRERVGDIVIQRRVETQPETINVPVERQEVVVERRTVDRPVAPGDKPFEEGEKEIKVPVYEEKVEVEKVPRVREEVVVEPREVTDQRRFTETVRRETAQVETQGDTARVVRREGQAAAAASSARAGFRPWAEVMPTYQQEWQTRYPNSGMTWQEVEPAYQLGYTNYYDPAYQDLTWEQAEPRLRQDWEARHPNTSWDRVRNFVHNEWDKLRGQP